MCPWLFPGGVSGLYNEQRGAVKDLNGPIHDLRSWSQYLMRCYDGRFGTDQLFTLYFFNVVQRHDNNNSGTFFFHDDNWRGKDQPSLEELKELIRDGDYIYISKLRYFAQRIKGSND